MWQLTCLKRLMYNVVPYSGKVWQGETLANWLFLSIWLKKVWWINRSVNRLSIVSTKLDGFSLTNHGRFAKFAKLSPCQAFLLYSITFWLRSILAFIFTRLKCLSKNYSHMYPNEPVWFNTLNIISLGTYKEIGWFTYTKYLPSLHSN